MWDSTWEIFLWAVSMSNYFDHLISCLNGMTVWLDWRAKSVKQAHLEDDAESVKMLYSLCKCKHAVSIGHLPFMGYNMELSNSDDTNLHSETESRRKHVSTSIANSSHPSLNTDPWGLLGIQCHDLYERTLKHYNKSRKWGAITARKDNSIESPYMQLRWRGGSYAAGLLLLSSCLTFCHGWGSWNCVVRRENMCVCTNKCIYDHTQDIHMLTYIQ